MKHFWMAVSVSCMAGSAMALWRQHLDAAFVFATIGALAWFLNYRGRMKELIGALDQPLSNTIESNQANEK